MAPVSEIEPIELHRRLMRGDKPRVLDVREAQEVATAAFPGAIHLPMSEIASRVRELDPAAEWVVICHHGIRSAQVAMYLAQIGFERVGNLVGGIDRWSLVVDHSIPRY
ncbi:MAG: rhodanese [Deltaproteobacteria bacterium]|nr:rhodanese [Deltaproteobacteria bacterium]